jgi:hypothetical protein
MDVDARLYWKDTELDVRAGDVLIVAASGQWTDLTYTCGPGGYPAPAYMRLFDGLRRCPQARWFELVGCVGKDLKNSFPIGERRTVTAPASGRLYLYANDVPGFYWNNRGSLSVSVTKAAPSAPPG